MNSLLKKCLAAANDDLKDQSVNDILKGKPAPSRASALQKDSAGYLTLSTDAIIHDFAQDLPTSEARLVAATQVPWFSGCTDDKVTQAMWPCCRNRRKSQRRSSKQRAQPSDL